MPSSITTRRTKATHSASRSVRAILAVLGIGGLAAACSVTAPDGPRDVGSEAYPQNLPQGNLSATSFVARTPGDICSMAYEDPILAGVIGSAAATRQAFDTGNMANSTPLPAGNGPVIFLK